MSIRGLWIFSFSTPEKNKILFSRTFPIVEKRAKFVEKDHYVAIPPQQELAAGLEKQLRLGRHKKERSKCSEIDQKPVFEVPITGGSLWPLLIIEQHGVLMCCLPFVEQGSHTRPPLIQIPGISSGFSLLLGMAEFLKNLPRNINETDSKFADLYLFVSQAAPFGSPIDISPITVKAALSSKSASAASPGNQKQPGWKPLQYKGRPQLYFSVKENIRAVQYDKPESCDMWDLYGTVTCHADLEGAVPDVSLTLAQCDSSPGVTIDNIIYHPFVQSAQTQGDFNTAGQGSCLLRFTPPLEKFPLCHYASTSLQAPPLQGFYQMKGEKTVDILLQLKLSEKVKNNFEYLEVQLPFFHRGAILSFDASPTQGNVVVSPDKVTLVWNIGQKFPNKTLEVLLKASVQFAIYDDSNPQTSEAQFCVKQNAFAQIFFKLSDYNQTGMTVDPKSIQISPSAKFKLTSVREYTSVDYKIWNSHGDAPSSFLPPPDLLNEMYYANALS